MILQKYISLIFLLSATAIVSQAGPTGRMSRQEYINKYGPLAIEEMNQFHIPASITMAQACLESADGNSDLTRRSNNHFGIKCGPSWRGPSVRHDDDARNECFRKYSDPLDSFSDHSKYLTTTPRYQFLFDYSITDYKKWAHGLKKAGYATDPAYANKLIKIIEDFNLHELDKYYGDKKYLANAGRAERRKQSSKSSGFTIDPYASRKVERRNGSNAFTAKRGDSYEAIAAEFNMAEWEIYKYNDAQKGDRPEPGMPVYLQSKKGKAPRGNDFHYAKAGETMQSIAQWYGIKVNSLLKMNQMREGEQPRAGQQISLRKRIK